MVYYLHEKVIRRKNQILMFFPLIVNHQPLYRQNDRNYIKQGVKNKKSIVERRKFCRRMMVWAREAHNLKTDLIFFKQGETLNADRYKSSILAPVVTPFCREHKLAFQQDSAPCHTATKIVDFLKSENVDFWTKQDWAPNSPDLNLRDYGI